MTPENLDRILSSKDSLQPSSTFARNVMAAIHREAAEPPPLRFPWLRFAAGLAGSGAMAASGTVLVMRAEPALFTVAEPLAQITPALACAAAALVLSLGIAALPRLLTRNSL